MFSTCTTSRVNCNPEIRPLPDLTASLTCIILLIKIASREIFLGQGHSGVPCMEGDKRYNRDRAFEVSGIV